MDIIVFIVMFIFLMFIGIPILVSYYYIIKEEKKEKKEVKRLVEKMKKLPPVHEMNRKEAQLSLDILDEYFELPNTFFHEQPIMDYYRSNKKRLLKLAKK